MGHRASQFLPGNVLHHEPSQETQVSLENDGNRLETGEGVVSYSSPRITQQNNIWSVLLALASLSLTWEGMGMPKSS